MLDWQNERDKWKFFETYPISFVASRDVTWRHVGDLQPDLIQHFNPISWDFVDNVGVVSVDVCIDNVNFKPVFFVWTKFSIDFLWPLL
jgi:hypothetical protein